MKQDNKLRGIEVWIAEPVSQPRKRLARAAMVAVSLLFLIFVSAAGATWVDLDFWKEEAPQAKKALRENRSTDKQSIAAVTVLHRDIYESIDLLQKAARSGGPVAAQARIALEEIEKQAAGR